MQEALAGDAVLVDSQLRTGGEEGLTNAQLRRWLAARGWDPARAAHDLKGHAAWRAAFCPEGRVLDSEVKNELAQDKVSLTGPDHKGRAVIVFSGKKHIPRPDGTEAQRFFCYSADAAIAMADPDLNPGGKVQFVFMAKGFGWQNFDVAGLSMLFKMIHAHYVERLETMYIHGCSATFEFLYRLVEPFVDPVTRRKVVLLPRNDEAAAAILEQAIGKEALPPILGGTGEAHPVSDCWAQLDLRGWKRQEAAAPKDCQQEEEHVLQLVA